MLKSGGDSGAFGVPSGNADVFLCLNSVSTETGRSEGRVGARLTFINYRNRPVLRNVSSRICSPPDRSNHRWQSDRSLPMESPRLQRINHACGATH